MMSACKIGIATAVALLLTLSATTTWSQNYEEVIHYHNDALGSPVAATDGNGDLLWAEEYAPYGSRMLHESREVDQQTGAQVESSWDEKQWFTGKLEETRTGLQYYGARWYEPEIGRFLSVDPVEFHPDNIFSFNRYAYANNNPYRYIDPDGRAIETPWDLFNVGLGVTSFAYNISIGNFGGAVIDAIGIVADTAATIVPGVPAGAGTIIRAKRLGDTAVDVAKTVPVSRAKYGDAADHIADAQKAGHPDVLTIARPGAPANREASIGGLPKVPGKQLDEYPPAMFKEGGAGASVRAISPRNNMGAGACIGNACRGLLNGDKVRIKVVE